MAADIHERIRDAERDAIKAVAELDLNLNACSVHSAESFDPSRVDLPAIVVSYEGGALQFKGGTNLSDDVGYPTLVGYYGVGSLNSPDDRSGPTLSQFQDVMRALFHKQKLAGVDNVWECEVNAAPLLNPQLPQFEKLLVAVSVVATARVERVKTSS